MSRVFHGAILPGYKSQECFSRLDHQWGLLNGSLRNLKAHTLGKLSGGQEKPMVNCHQWVLLRGIRNLKAHKSGKTDVFKGFQIFQDSPR